MDDPKNSERISFKYTPNDKPIAQTGPIELDGTSIPENIVEKAEEPLFNWSAPNAFSVRKSPLWYLSLLIITVVIATGIFFATKDKITTAVILVCGLLFGVYAAKKPKVVNYQLTKNGFTINGRYYQFGNYRSFSIINHGDAGTVALTPLKRFAPYMYIYFSSDMEQQITSTLIDVLPKETEHRDMIDRVLRKIGF